MFWPIVSKEEYIDIIAPSGAIGVVDVAAIETYLKNLGLRPRIPNNLLGAHPFCAHNDATRWAVLRAALQAEDSRLIWCVRGGHGVTRIMPDLVQLPKPAKQKLLIGFSDISSLHLWLNQAWQWPSIHGPGARQAALGTVDAKEIDALYRLCFAGVTDYALSPLIPLNTAAEQLRCIEGITSGGCISVLQTSIGTPWQLNARDKILFLEDINEQPYRIDRALVHLANSGVFNEVRAIIFGDFGERANETKLLEWVLAESITDYLRKQNSTVPIFRHRGFGHGTANKPLPFGVPAKIIKQNNQTQLIF